MDTLKAAQRRLPALAQVQGIWRRNGLKPSSIVVYSQWVRRFIETFHDRAKRPADYLTAVEVRRFAQRYARRRRIDPAAVSQAAHKAMQAWSDALSALGLKTPLWKKPAGIRRRLDPLLNEYLEYRRIHRGLSAPRERRDVADIGHWLRFLGRRRRPIRRIRLKDTDDYLICLRRRYALATVSVAMSSLRQFLRFLHATGRLRFDLAETVQSPRRRPSELPRALPWAAVRKILQTIDRNSSTGRRDYAVLLLMSLYGLGAAEVIGLTLDRLDWTGRTLTVVRPKTGCVIRLPFLPAAARAVADYLRLGRPVSARTRSVFLRRQLPYAAFTSSAIRFMVRKYARSAGVSAPVLGAHVLRHSHASRQIDQQAPPRVLSDILGHRDSQTTSIYTRVAVERLRGLALPVPR